MKIHTKFIRDVSDAPGYQVCASLRRIFKFAGKVTDIGDVRVAEFSEGDPVTSLRFTGSVPCELIVNAFT